MATYVYRCDSGHEYEKTHSITAKADEVCDVCGASVRRVVQQVRVKFRGDGFYTNDSATEKSRHHK